MADDDPPLATFLGINHVALEVGDLDDALDFYGSLFACDLRGRTGRSAFLDAGDQFLALSEGDDTPAVEDQHRHFGLVVDDVSVVERRLEALGIETLDTAGVEFHDPWGNRVQIVEYAEIQFTKADHVLEGMDNLGLEKSDDAIEELTEKGMEPPDRE